MLFGTNAKPISVQWARDRRLIAERAREIGAVQAYARSPKGDRECWTRAVDGSWKRVRREKANECAGALEEG